MISRFLSDRVVDVLNFAVSGRSTKTFIEEGRWNKVLETSRPGDYLLIQFGHNNSHDKHRPESAGARADFPNYIEQHVREARDKGMVPILVTPVHRRLFVSDGTHLDEHTSHSLSPYASAMKTVAARMKVPLVDLYKTSGELMERLGEEGCARLACREDDPTHFSEEGAIQMASLVADGLSRLDCGLSGYVD